MSEPVSPHFLPWLRTGLASHINETASDGIAPGDTASISVAVRLTASGGEEINEAVQSPSIRLRGPGEVIGIDPSLVVRHDPEPGETDAERNYFALVEFSAPDLPWRYTPARPDDKTSPNRLQPWIALVVVEEREGVWLETGPHCRLPILHVDDITRELPDLEQSWAWAHVHADHDLKDGVGSAIDSAPEAFRSRLMCPRYLSPNRGWIACVVPVFKVGLLAGLGMETSASEVLAWDKASGGELDIPVYHYWRFHTGPKGDFESLVKRLRARELPEDVGFRDLDISKPGGGLPESKVVISYQGALLSLAGKPKPWPASHRGQYKKEMAALLNAGLVRKPTGKSYDALKDDPVVGPPAYAIQQAQARSVPEEGRPPEWLGELNTEPQHRTAAGLGAQVVRRDQEHLMASAWEFAASAAEASRVLTRARTAAEVGKRAKLHFDLLTDADFIQIAGPAMARLHHPSGKTIHGVVGTSALPGGLFSGAFRRLSRTAPGLRKTSAKRGIDIPGAVTQKALQDPVAFVQPWASVHSPANADVENETQGARAVAPVARTILVGGIEVDMVPRVDVITLPYTGDSQWVNTLVPESRAALDPVQTIRAMVQSRIKNLPLAEGQDVPDRVFIRPRFTTPMYKRLAALSVEYLVPGIGEIPNDTLGLLEANPSFIEAYMSGLNHEMGREFLWREFPARLSDTWFQHFWNSGSQGAEDIKTIGDWLGSASLGENGPKGAPKPSLVLLIRSALLRRYPELRIYAVEAMWKKKGKDKNVRREKTDGAVYQPIFTARLTGDITVFGFTLEEAKARGSTDPNKHPGYFFVLEQPPGAPRFGLDEQQKSGSLTHWNDLSWPDLANDKGEPPTFVDVNKPPSDKKLGPLETNSDAPNARDAWGADAAAMARITFQRPVRMLVHADSMLPDAPTKPNPKERK